MGKTEVAVKDLMKHHMTNIIQKQINKDARIKFKSRIPGLIRKHFLSRKHNSFDLPWLIAVVNL